MNIYHLKANTWPYVYAEDPFLMVSTDCYYHFVDGKIKFLDPNVKFGLGEPFCRIETELDLRSSEEEQYFIWQIANAIARKSFYNLIDSEIEKAYKISSYGTPNEVYAKFQNFPIEKRCGEKLVNILKKTSIPVEIRESELPLLSAIDNKIKIYIPELKDIEKLVSIFEEQFRFEEVNDKGYKVLKDIEVYVPLKDHIQVKKFLSYLIFKKVDVSFLKFIYHCLYSLEPTPNNLIIELVCGSYNGFNIAGDLGLIERNGKRTVHNFSNSMPASSDTILLGPDVRSE